MRILADVGSNIDLDQKLTAAKRHFPDRSHAIDELALRNEDFCTLCIDLADAEAAARKWESSTAPKRDKFRAEYLELASDLAKEIESALDAAVVIALDKRRPKAPE